MYRRRRKYSAATSSAGRFSTSITVKISIAAATCAPGVIWLPDFVPSPPRRRGSRAAAGDCPPGFPLSRERQNESSTILRVIGGFAGDRDVVDVALAQPGPGDPHEGAVLLHFADRAVAGVAHRCPQSADQLVDDVADRALMRHAAFDPLGDELQRARHLLLEIAVGRAARHRPDRAHPAVVFVAAPLIEKDLARTLVGAGEQRAEHRAIGPGGDRLREVAGKLDAAIRDHRDPGFAAFRDRVDDRGELRDADPRHHAGRADRPRTDADLDRIGAGLDQGPRTLRRRDIAGDYLGIVREPANLAQGAQHPVGMTVCGIDNQNVETGCEQRFGALDALAAGAGRRSDPETAMLILAGRRISLRFLDVLDGYQADAPIGFVDDKQLLDAMLVQEAFGVLAGNTFAHRDKAVPRHQLGDRLPRVVGESDIAVGQNAGEPAGTALYDRDAGELVVGREPQRVGEGLLRMDRDRVDDHAGLEFLDLADFVGLLFERHIAVDDADPAGLRHCDR